MAPSLFSHFIWNLIQLKLLPRYSKSHLWPHSWFSILFRGSECFACTYVYHACVCGLSLTQTLNLPNPKWNFHNCLIKLIQENLSEYYRVGTTGHLRHCETLVIKRVGQPLQVLHVPQQPFAIFSKSYSNFLLIPNGEINVNTKIPLIHSNGV